MLDLEIAFRRSPDDEERIKKKLKGRYVADRIDFAELANKDGQINLQFVEVKLTTDSRIKKEREGIPEVVEQMENYRNFLISQKEHIANSYKTIARNYIELNMYKGFPVLGLNSSKDVLTKFCDSGVIENTPRLLIMGDASAIEKWKTTQHHSKLNGILTSRGFPSADTCVVPK